MCGGWQCSLMCMFALRPIFYPVTFCITWQSACPLFGLACKLYIWTGSKRWRVFLFYDGVVWKCIFIELHYIALVALASFHNSYSSISDLWGGVEGWRGGGIGLLYNLTELLLREAPEWPKHGTFLLYNMQTATSTVWIDAALKLLLFLTLLLLLLLLLYWYR